MTIYGKGCISNYRNCSLCYVWYSVLYRMLTLFLGLQEQIRIIIDKCFLPIVSIKQHWAIDCLFIVVGFVVGIC